MEGHGTQRVPSPFAFRHHLLLDATAMRLPLVEEIIISPTRADAVGTLDVMDMAARCRRAHGLAGLARRGELFPGERVRFEAGVRAQWESLALRPLYAQCLDFPFEPAHGFGPGLVIVPDVNGRGHRPVIFACRYDDLVPP